MKWPEQYPYAQRGIKRGGHKMFEIHHITNAVGELPKVGNPVRIGPDVGTLVLKTAKFFVVRWGIEHPELWGCSGRW